MRPATRKAIVLALTVTLAALACSGCGGSSATGTLRSRLLTVADLPAGWSTAPVSAKGSVTHEPCLSNLYLHTKGWSSVSAGFVEGTSIPSIGEVLASGPSVHQRWGRVERALARCHNVTIPLGRLRVPATVRPLAFPSLAATSAAYSFAFTIAGIKIGFDLVLFETSHYGGYIAYSDLGGPSVATVHTFLSAAIAKATTGSTTRIADAVSIASAPVQTVNTKLGSVAYRAIGAGPPLVMIMGYGGTMEVWDRSLIDTLARHYRVVIFDNAGIGGTQSLPPPLTIDAMANQTSALIDALHLGRVNVLGWSMGTMVAQALAVLHPTQVGRIVLAASYPGDGTAIQPPQTAINALASSNQQTVMADLFPANQMGAQNSYLASVTSYPAAAPAPAAIVAAQATAIKQWWNGGDAAGKRAGAITAPTLIADGTLDRLDPLANSHGLATLIRGATIELYPDAGHGFLFQDQATFVPTVEQFLGR
jgi:pimeloyl-ACP methyl ester carboxylesterase